MDERIERIGDRDDAGPQRDLRSDQSAGITLAVHPFVMMKNHQRRFLETVNIA